MNYERVEAVIKLLNCVLVAYMWTYLIPITPSTPKRRWNRLAYTLLIMTALLLMDWSTRVLAARLPGVASKTVLSYLPVMSDILPIWSCFAASVPPGDRPEGPALWPPWRLDATGSLSCRSPSCSLFFWVLWFPDRQLELSMALLPSDSRVVMLMAVQSIMYLLLLALHLASPAQEAPPGVVSASFSPVGRRRLQPAAVLPDPPVRQIRDHDGTAVYGGIQFAAGNLY